MFSDKRFKRFNKQFSSLFSSNPYFEKVRELYANDVIKTVTSANKILKKIKITKKKELYKSSVKTANDLNKTYTLFTGPQILNANKLNERFLKIDKINIESLGLWIHENEVINIQRTNPNGFYIQTTKFYNKNNVEQTGQYKKVILYARKMLKGEYRKNFYQSIVDNLTIDYEWLVRSWTKEGHADYSDGNYATIETVVYKNIPKVQNINFKQLYQRNNNSTCVYDGFLSFFNQDCKMKKTVYNKLIKNKDIYAKAYTDETLPEICEFTNSTLIIKDLITGKDKVFRAKNARYCLEFLNTKYNHLDILKNTYSNVVECSEEEYESVKSTSDFYIEKYHELITLDKTYKIKDDEFKTVYKQWKKDINYTDLLIDENNEELKLINEYDFSAHCFFNEFEINNELYNEIDIKKAYFNYAVKEHNPNYHGVPAGSFINFECDNFTISDFNKQIKNNLIGYYKVIVQKINNHNELFNKIGIEENKPYVFTSVQIEEFKQYITFNFVRYSVSPSTSIPFPEIFKNKNNKLSHYCKAVGLLNPTNKDISITVKPLACDKNYYSIIQDDNLSIYEYNGLIKINNNNNIVKSGIHIYNYIHSYTKTLIFQQLKEVNINDVFGVKLDSIVIKKTAKINNILPAFHQDFKECNIEKMFPTELTSNISTSTNRLMAFAGFEKDDFGFETYRSRHCYFRPLFESNDNDYYTFNKSFLPNNEPITSSVVFMSGKGGSGKSYSVLSNLKNVCMVSTCWNLTQGKKEEFESLFALSIHKLLGKDSEKIKVYSKYLFLDELTMWSKEDVLKAINQNPTKFIFLAGDIDYNGKYYQCSLQNEIVNPSQLNCQFVTFIKNYRFDDELNTILDNLRKCNTKQEQQEFINIHFKNNFKNKEDIIFDDKTIGISDLNDTKNDDVLTNYFLSKGSKPQYFIKTTIFQRGQYKGAKLENIPDHTNYECKLFKTIHSFQGLDLKRDEKIVISNKKNFDEKLWYTAFSRAKRLDQITILI
jgi:hypothetical protein